MEIFKKYLTVGVINTAIHWIVFLATFYLIKAPQSTSNFTAFLIAVSFSYMMNAKYTFKKKKEFKKYLMYISFMGLLSYLTGYIADKLNMPSLLTLIIFSLISLVVGFIYSKKIIFKEKKWKQ